MEICTSIFFEREVNISIKKHIMLKLFGMPVKRKAYKERSYNIIDGMVLNLSFIWIACGMGLDSFPDSIFIWDVPSYNNRYLFIWICWRI